MIAFRLRFGVRLGVIVMEGQEVGRRPRPGMPGP